MNRPTLIIDTREQRPLTFEHLASQRGTLHSGDYSVKGFEPHFAIERKSVADLCQSVTRGRERFERELHRLRGFDFARLLIVGTISELRLRAADPKAVVASLSAFEARWRVPVVWEADPGVAAYLVERWAWFWWKERPVDGPCPVPPAVPTGHAASLRQL